MRSQKSKSNGAKQSTGNTSLPPLPSPGDAEAMAALGRRMLPALQAAREAREEELNRAPPPPPYKPSNGDIKRVANALGDVYCELGALADIAVAVIDTDLVGDTLGLITRAVCEHAGEMVNDCVNRLGGVGPVSE